MTKTALELIAEERQRLDRLEGISSPTTQVMPTAKDKDLLSDTTMVQTLKLVRDLADELAVAAMNCRPLLIHRLETIRKHADHLIACEKDCLR